MKKIFISLMLFSLSSFALELPWSNQFSEPNAILTKFTDTEDYDLVEMEAIQQQMVEAKKNERGEK